MNTKMAVLPNEFKVYSKGGQERFWINFFTHIIVFSGTDACLVI